ncbi:MAG: dipeptide/oligopeptide/nickel ABC transporter ATP-binding protein [Roseibium sp.]
MLTVKNLDIHVPGKTILKDVSFDLKMGQTLCVVGESGSGKSSLLRALNGLIPANFASISFHPQGRTPIDLEGRWQRKPGLPETRWVMQDPISALDPKLPLGVSIGESVFTENPTTSALRVAVAEALRDVELPSIFATRLPAEISMGQAQRACLARALIARPSLIFFDEPLSALDAIVQKQVAATMKRLQERFGMTYITVTHDLGFASAYADHILVLRDGRVEANQPADTFFNAPESSYCEKLIQAARDLGGLPEIPVQGTKSLEPQPC